MSDTVTVWHPDATIVDGRPHSRPVAKADLDAWLEQGWLDSRPGPADPEQEPPRSGRGSGVGAWAAYAQTLGYDTDGKTRDELVAMVDAGPARPQADGASE